MCPAFRDDAGPALLRRIEQDEPPRPRQLNPEVPPDLENVVRKAMAKSRDDRYATAAELADDLQRFLDGVPTVAKPPRLLERAGKWVRRHRKGVAAAVGRGRGACACWRRPRCWCCRRTPRSRPPWKRRSATCSGRKPTSGRPRSVVDQFGARLAERLAGIPGAEPLRQELLGETLRYYQGFIEQAGDDPVLQEDIAVTYTKIGGITERTGRIGEAVAAYRSSAAILEQCRPGSRTPARPLADWPCAAAIWGCCWPAAARRTRGSAISRRPAKCSSGSARFPAEADCAAALALTENNLGLLQSQTGAADQAEQSYLAAVETQRELVRRASGGRQAPGEIWPAR